MEFKALSNGERSINIISSDGKIVFHVNPQYPLTRLIVDGCMDETLISELGLEGQSRNNKLVKNCLTSESDLIYDCLEKAGLEKIIIAINSSSMTRNNIKTNISLMGEIDSAWDISKRGARIRISIPGFDKQASELKRSIKIEEFEELDLQEFINDVIKSNINEIASNPESVEKANLRSNQY